jgi:intracellular septation protein A
MKNKKSNQPPLLVQFVINFVIPLVILTRFSDESQLGATRGLLLALAFPVVYELYNVRKRRKLSVVSALAIGGILVTGAIGLLGLSEGWLAVRRSVPYFAMSLAVLISIGLKRPLLSLLLPHILDMKKVGAAAKKKQMSDVLAMLIQRAGLLLSGVLLAIGMISFALTKIVIMSEVGTSGFNQEYARLRLWSLAATTLPLFIGMTGVIFYLARSIEKLTGLDIDDLMKKP